MKAQARQEGRIQAGSPVARLKWVGVAIVLLVLAMGAVGSRAEARLPDRSQPPDLFINAASESGTSFSTTSISIPTYPYAQYLEQHYSPTYNMTYPVLDWDAYNAADPQPAPKDYELLVLENAYLKVTVLPELGGRLYQIINKATGQNQLYQNPVIKPTHWGPPEQGWWLSAGGIEWCLPVDEHGYEWGIPWSWSVVTAADGVTVTVQDTPASDRLRAMVDIHLPSDRAYVVVKPRLENPTSAPIDYKFWINAAIAPGAANKPTEDLAFVFNAPKMSVHSTGDDRLPGAFPIMPTGPDYLFNWPVHEGIDYSHLRNWTRWLGFFEYPQAIKGFSGVYDEGQEEGLVRVFPPEIARGSKGFATGWSQALPWSTWTDKENSGGVEIHGGVAPTFWDTTQLPPGGFVTWREFWYPVQELGAVTAASEAGALRVTKAADTLQVGLQPTQAWAPGESELFVWQRTSCTELAHWYMGAVEPAQGYQNGLVVGDFTTDEVSVAYVNADHEVLIGYGPTDCLDYVTPEPHLGYGLNVRLTERIPSLVNPLDFDWVKLWEEYSGLPTTPLDQKVLFNINCAAFVYDMNGWRSHVRGIAQAGSGLVQAYEICNEPNVQNANMGGHSPDPQLFTDMLRIAWEEIKAVDPKAMVVSGGLAPVGRIPEPWPCGEGNNCVVMDEWVFLEDMLENGAAAYMDAFGYHPYGFASPPERDPDLVSNAFAFRGVENLHEILINAGWNDMPVWITEFNWFRRPLDDGQNCDGDQTYLTYFKWQEVSAETQADYLVRAFEYADTHWPWLEGMFVWNLDWHDYKLEHPCLHSRFYALRRWDGTSLGAPTPAYASLATMPKRPGLLAHPILSVTPERWSHLAVLEEPRTYTTVVTIDNEGVDTLTWTAAISPTSDFAPTLSSVSGTQGEPLTVTVDTGDFGARGTYTATLVVDALPDGTLNTPQDIVITVKALNRDDLKQVFLPLILDNYSPPSVPVVPHGPSKIGVHAIGEGGTLDLVQWAHDGGGHVAVVKGLSFGYLCQVKAISPETVTVGRWPDSYWETIVPEGDPATKASQYLQRHMQEWAPYAGCVDYWEVLNEVDPLLIDGHVWLANFYKAAMDIAEANGYKLGIFSYSTGVPEIYEWEAIVETGVFARAQQGGHILSLHEYGAPLMSDLWGEAMPSYPGQDPDDPSLPRYPDRGVMAGRYRHLYRDLLIPRNEVIPLIITETNLGIDDPETRAAYFLDEIAFYDDRLREDDYVLGMAIFTLGGGIVGWDHFDYYDFLPDLADRIVSLKDQ
ncbi:MAG: DUF5107 domain-containing protein [Anaerolineae bacterium]